MKERFKSVAIIVLLALTAAHALGEAPVANSMLVTCNTDGVLKFKPVVGAANMTTTAPAEVKVTP